MPARKNPPRQKTQAPTASLPSKILESLAKIDRPADFCTSGQCPTVLPGLTVSKLGDIALPLSATEAKRLIKVCHQAPYGKGTETVVDTKVRKVWELDPQHFKLQNSKWQTMLETVLRDIESNLGLPTQSLAAHLYKLLVYEKGGFFLPHRDGEKLDRMVATLVINLPSKHSGGDLVVRHQGDEKTITTPGASAGLETEYAAFYADCQHEVKPLLSGYRLCLTYNLVLAKPRSKVATSAPRFDEITTQLEEILTDWEAGSHANDDPLKLAVMLEHGYTQSGLSINKLKGVDLARAKTVFEAAERAQCDAHLALVTLWQSGSAEGDYDDYGFGRSRRHTRWYDDDEDAEEEDDSDSGSDYTMGEVYDSSLSANCWSDRNGKKVAFGRIPLAEHEIVSAIRLTDTDPANEEFEGYTGNAGMTLERWYHQAAIVLWPRRQQCRVWCDAGTDAAITGLKRMIAELGRTKKNRDQRLDHCRQFAKQIIETWRRKGSSFEWNPVEREAGKPTKVNRESFWESLVKLDCPELALMALEQIMPHENSLTFPVSFLQWMAKQGWSKFAKHLIDLATQSDQNTIFRNVTILRQLATMPESSKIHNTICSEMATILVAAIEKIDSGNRKSWDAPDMDRCELIVDLARALVAVGNSQLLDRFFDWQFDHERYGLVEVQVPAAIKLVPQLKLGLKGSPAIRKWIQRIRESLQDRTKSKPKKPTDWSRDSKLDCKCADCVRLAAFLADATQAEARFPLAKQRRQHLHNVIGRNQSDCTHQTLRVGSPQVLVCKKTTGSYTRACKIYQEDLKHLAAIQKLESRKTGAK